MARNVFHGKWGELRQAYSEGLEGRFGALGLVLNIITLWNIYLHGCSNYHTTYQYSVLFFVFNTEILMLNEILSLGLLARIDVRKAPTDDQW